MPVKKLTEMSVERISLPEKGRLDLWDSVITGLTLRVTKQGVKTWCFVYRAADGKQNRMTFGHFPAISVLKARTIAKQALEELAMGNDPLSIREEQARLRQQSAEENLTVRKMSEDFIERHARPKTRRWKYTQQVFRNHINPAIGDIPAKDVQRKDVIRLLDKIKASKSPHAANHVLVALRKMYNWAIERDELQFNPCHVIKKPVATNERERVLSKDEIKALWKACDDIGYPYGPTIQLLLLTGQRRSEIAGLKWDYINLDEKIIRLPAANVKAKRSHDIPLSDMAVNILRSLPRFTGSYVFTSTHGRKAIDCFSKTKIKLEAAIKSDDWRVHDLRRSCATSMAELGVPRHSISRVLNHSEGGVTRLYDRHSYLNEKRQALNLWAQHLWEMLNGGGTDNVVKLERAG